MAPIDIPSSGLSLHGATQQPGKDGPHSAIARSAILLRLNEELVRDLQQCSNNGDTLRLLAGKKPRLQYSKKTTHLNVLPETFQHELYSSSGSSSNLYLSALVTQQASIEVDNHKNTATAGSDSALANLKQSLASYAQEKEANKTTISSSIISNAKARTSSLHPHRGLGKPHAGSATSSPSLGASSTVNLGPTLTSAASDLQAASKIRAMNKVVVHLLAIKPLTDDEIGKKTRIPRIDRVALLQKIAHTVPGSSEWTLREKAYRDLDVWKFNYQSEADRQSAIKNAVRAFDRLRLAKDDKLWQMLLPEKDRGKGTVLSRLHSGAAAQANRDRSSSHVGSATPNASKDAAVEKKVESLDKRSPALGPSSTPKVAASTAKGAMSIEKRLKESAKQRAAEDTKEQKRKVKEAKEAAVSEKEIKAKSGSQRVSRPNGRVKSDEVVHSSDEEEAEAFQKKVKAVAKTSKSSSTSSGGSTSQEQRRNESSSSKGQAVTRPDNHTANPSSKAPEQPTKKRQANNAANGKATPIPSSQTPTTTPGGRIEKHAPVKTTSVVKKTQLSPQKLDAKSRMPSPLGPNRPGPPSTVSNKGTESASSQPAGSPARVTKSTAAVNGTAKSDRSSTLTQKSQLPAAGRKRHLDDVEDDSSRAKKSTKLDHAGISTKAVGTNPATNGLGTKDSGAPLKRKANEMSNGINDHDLAPAQKHRRTESSSTNSATASSQSVSGSSQTTTARTSVASPSIGRHSPAAWQRSPSGSAASSSSEAMKLSWERALEEAEKFRTQYYPAYSEMYDQLMAKPVEKVTMEERRKLHEMHERLKQMKKEINLAAA